MFISFDFIMFLCFIFKTETEVQKTDNMEKILLK